MSNADRVDAYLKRRNESKISNTNTAKVSNTDRMDAYLANRTIDTNSRVRNNGHIEDTRYKLYGYQTKEAYDSDVAKYTWAEANKGLSYADVKKRKETATGDELNYLNQYGTLVGYNNLDDYDAELNDLSYIDNIGFKNKALSTVYNALDNMGINMAFSDEEKAQLDRLNSDKAYKQELTNKRNLFKDYHSFDKYADIANRPDFEENSKFSGEGLQDLGIMGYTADPNGSIKRALTGAFESAIYGDETNTSFTGDSYYRINTGETKGESTEADYSRKFYAMLTDEEKATFNYIYNTQGKEEAQKFLDDMEKLLSRRANNQMNEELNELADSGFGGSALVTGARILTAPTASLASGANLIEGAISGDYNPYSYAGTLKNVNDYGQQAVSSNIAEATPNANVFGVNVPSFLYDTSLSTVDSTIGGALFGSNYSVIMGMGAFQTSARELADKGASQQDIWVQAGISGLAEIITEHISLDQFEKLIKDTDISTWKKLVQSALRQTLYEGSEEVSSDIINHIADELYNGGASEMSQKIKDYIQMGYSEEDARTKAAQEFAVQVGSSFVGGALSGGTMGAIASGVNLAYNSEIGKQLRANNNLDVIDNTANMIDKESDAYKRYANITNGGSIANATNAQIATTYNAIANQLSNEIANAQISDVVAMLKTKGITENVEATGKAIQNFIANGYSTKGISKSDVKILANERVADIVEQIHNGSLEFSLENSKAKVEQYNNLRKAETMRTVFQDATNIERTEDGYRITNEDGTTHVIQNDNITTTESDVMGYVSKYNNEAQSIWLDNYRNSGNIEMFDTAFSEVYALAKDGNALDNNMLAKYGTVLGYKNVADIYTAGTKLARQESQMSAEAIQQVLKDFKAENLKSGEFTYKNVKLDGKTYNIDPNKLSYKKRQVFNYAQGMSALGLNVRVIDDKGKISLNGQYDRESNSITINLSATFNGKNIKKFSQKYVINTFAHELTHYLEVNAKEAYRPLYNLVKSGLQSRYVSVKGETVSVWDAQIKEEFDVAKNGRNISDEEAMRIAESEVIARACEDVLNDNQQMIDILSQSDSGTLQTIRDAISKFFDKFKAMVAKLMNGFNSNSLEAQAIRDIDGLLDEMRSAWADAFTQAIARTQITEEMEKASGIQTDAETGTVVATQDSRKQTLSLTYERLGYKSYEECVNDVANEINKKANINDVEKVKRWIKAEESIAALIMREQNRQYLDYEADDRYEAIKKNSDYKQGTFDLSNLCRKREIFTKMFDALQRENPDILFDADDIATIRQVLVDSHYEVACALCYVEDRRQNMGEIADAFIGFYKQALESDSKLLFKYVPGKGGEVKKTGLYPTKAQRDKYGLSATQYKANDPYVPKQVDLVTYEGLKNLQKDHPTIAYAFERYNNSRGQQSARVIEGHAEYKREVLNYTDAMVKKANDLGGLRVFSFSDFEAIHLIDVCQIIVDCAKMGVKIQTYTKVPEFAALVRNTGIKLNRSLIPANVGSQNAYARVMENGKQKFVKVKPYANGIAKYKGNDVLAFDNVEGIDVTSKYFLDETDNANIGNILIGMSEDQIKIAMTDPFIDYIIPFHTGQKLSVLHAKGIAEWKNYKDVQLDKKLPGSTSKEKEINIYRVIEKYNPTNKYEFTEAFLKECEEQKFRPRFDEFITKDADGNYQYTEGYYKLLLDFKMFDSNGNILLQENVRPDIDEELAKKILNEGKKREEQIRFDDDIVNKVKEALADKHTLNSAKRSNGVYENKAIEHFGTTENFNVAGYILNDGQMIDFSGKHWGDTNSKFRQVDHEDIYEVMEKSGDNRKQFMDRGNIRISPEAPGINISTKAEPTAEQYAKIKEFINTIKDGNRFYVDIEDTKPHKVNYNGKISADRVVNDIKSFYETGVMPTGSEGSLSEFLYSSKRDLSEKLELKFIDKDGVENYKADSDVLNMGYAERRAEVKKLFKNSLYNQVVKFVKGDDVYYAQLVEDTFKKNIYGTESTQSGKDAKTAIIASNGFVNLAENAEYILNIPEQGKDKPFHKDAKTWDYFLKTIKYGDMYYDVLMVVKNTFDGENVLYDIQIEESDPTSTQLRDSDVRTASNKNVSNTLNKVKWLLSTKRTTEEKLTAENEKLKADIDNLRKLVRLQGKETNGFIPTKSSIESAAKSILKSAVSTYDRASLEKDLANVWTKLQKGASIESLNDDIRTIADNVVADIKDEVEVDKTYKQMLRNMRATKVRLTENQIAYAKQRYGENYRNAFMGKVILAKNGQSLDTLWEEWTERHPEVFEEGLSEEDMVDGLLEAYATIKEASEYVVELDTELATNAVMQTITEKLWNIASYQTVADKYADQIKQMKAEHRKEMDALKKARDDQRLADDMHYKKLLAQVREQRDERINAIKEFTKMRKETEKQRVERKKTLTKIERISKSLRDKLATDSSKKNVPVNLKVPVLDLLNALDFSSQQLLGMRGGENAFKPTQKDLSIASAMAKLNEQVKASVSAQEDGGFMIDLPGDYADTVAQINTKVTEIQSKVGDSVFVLQQMDNETLNDIADMLVVMNTSVSQMNSLIASRNKHSVDGIAKEIIEESQKKGKRFNFANQGAFARLANGADDFINKKQITPYYFFKHLGSGGVKIFEELQDGFDKYAFHIQDIINYSKENWNGKQVKEWAKDIKKFDIKEMPTQEMIDEGITEGRDVHFEMTVPQIMSLYCLNKREQARKHIEGKGIKIAEFKNGAKMSGDKVVRLTQEQVGEITKVLTEEQLKVADAIQKHMNTVCKNWMNEITMKRFGIIGALEENYFPIKSDSNALSVEANDNNAQGIYRLLNMSFTKQLNINANNEIVVGDIFTVFTDHATDMAKYNTIALPTLDLIKVLNYNETSKTEGSQLQSLRLRNELDTAYGKRAVQYISKMLTDLNSAVRAEQGNELVSTLNRNYKIAAVGANLQVALLQGTSAIRASYVLNPKYIARGYAHRPQVKRVQQECGISAWKQLGFYQINVNRGLEHDIRQDESVYDKITDASMKGAEFMDNLTWGYLYNACEEWARGETQFAVDSEEFRQAVNDKFREVVYSTQVVDSTLTRSDLMRIQDGLAKMATSFMAEPTLTYNMVYDAFNGFISDIRKGSTTGQALRSNGRQIAKAMMAFGVAAILESALRAGIAKLRKPEDEEEYWRKLLDYFLSELNPFSKIPYVKDILEIAQGYGSSNMSYGGIESAFQAFNKIKKIVQKGETPTYKEVYIVVNAASQISGVAGSGAMRDVVMLWNTLCRVMGWESLIIK